MGTKYHLERKHLLLQALIGRHKVDQVELKELQEQVDPSGEGSGEQLKEFAFDENEEMNKISSDGMKTPSEAPEWMNKNRSLSHSSMKERSSKLIGMVSNVARTGSRRVLDKFRSTESPKSGCNNSPKCKLTWTNPLPAISSQRSQFVTSFVTPPSPAASSRRTFSFNSKRSSKSSSLQVETRTVEVQATPETFERKTQAGPQVTEQSSQCEMVVHDNGTFQNQACPRVASILQRHGVTMEPPAISNHGVSHASSGGSKKTVGTEATVPPPHVGGSSRPGSRHEQHGSAPSTSTGGRRHYNSKGSSGRPNTARNLEPLHTPPTVGASALQAIALDPEVVARGVNPSEGSGSSHRKVGIAGRGSNSGGSTMNASWGSNTTGSSAAFTSSLGTSSNGLGNVSRKARRRSDTSSS